MRLEAELRSRGHHVTFVTGSFDHARKAQIGSDALRAGPNLTVLRLPSYQANVGLARMWCHFVCAIKLWFAAIGTRWDVIVTSSIPPEVLLATRFLRKDAVVLDIRDIWPDALGAYGSPSRAARLFGAYCDLLFKLTLKHCQRIMVVAPGYRRWLERYGALAHGKVKFVPLGFRREDFRPLAETQPDYVFCYAGGATPQFDIREFAEEFGDKSGIVLGSGPLLETWQQSFPNAEFRGAVPRAEAMDVMARSERLLFPSNPFAQLPNKAFDYFALGHSIAFGGNCTRATRSLLALRQRHETKRSGEWSDYRALEKEAIAKRAADIVEGAVS